MPGRGLVCSTRAALLFTFLFLIPFAETAWGQFTEAVNRPDTMDGREAVYATLAREAALFERQGRLLKQLIELVRPSVVHIEAAQARGSLQIRRRNRLWSSTLTLRQNFRFDEPACNS